MDVFDIFVTKKTSCIGFDTRNKFQFSYKIYFITVGYSDHASQAVQDFIDGNGRSFDRKLMFLTILIAQTKDVLCK